MLPSCAWQQVVAADHQDVLVRHCGFFSQSWHALTMHCTVFAQPFLLWRLAMTA